MLWAQIVFAGILGVQLVMSIGDAVRDGEREHPYVKAFVYLALLSIIYGIAVCAGAFDKIIGWPK